MPTKKQLSFIDGELSPALRFKTDLASYATGLSKLYNMLVRRSGGASNRAGFRYMYTPAFQGGLETQGRVNLVAAQLPLDTDQSDVQTVLVLHPSLIGETPELWSTGSVVTALGNNLATYILKNIKISQYKNTLILSNGISNWAWKRISGPDRLAIDLLQGDSIVQTVTPTYPTTNVVSVVYAPTLAYLVQKPVAYQIYQVLTSGAEVLFYEYTRLGTNAGGWPEPVEPYVGANAGVRNVLSLQLDSDSSVKHYNVYRATRNATAGTSSLDVGNWGLVGRIPKPATDRTVIFHDYIDTPDFTKTPPDEDYLYGKIGRQLDQSRRVGHYQQRRVVVPSPSFSNLDEGAVAVSNIGTPNMMDTHRVFTDTGAFDFKTPIGNQGRIVATLELERLVLFTEDAVIVVQGGDRGVLTPTTVNPKVVSRVGCSNQVAPISMGSRGFFLSRSGERVMVISFGIDETVSVADISILSDHLLDRAPVVQLAHTSGKEDILWLLHEDGTLISAVVSENGKSYGFSTHNTDGFIESMAPLPWDKVWAVTVEERDNKTYESLAISVVRDGVRYIESLAPREDATTEQKCFVDSASAFGRRLVRNRSAGYYEINPSIGTKNYELNITGGTIWDETEVLTVTEIATLAIFSASAPATIFFYYDEGGIQKTLRFDQTGFTSTSVITGRVTSVVPAELRNVTALAPSDIGERYTRWLFAYNTFDVGAAFPAVPVNLSRFNGRDVSVFADDMVYSSPNNPNQPTLSVVAGVLTLPEKVAWGFVGLPYESDLETLDLDTSDERTFTDAMKLINEVGIAFFETKGGYVGQTESGNILPISVAEMEEIISRSDETFEEVTSNINEHISQDIPAHWEPTGRVLIKQVDPTPMTVLAVYPKGVVGK